MRSRALNISRFRPPNCQLTLRARTLVNIPMSLQVHMVLIESLANIFVFIRFHIVATESEAENASQTFDQKQVLCHQMASQVRVSVSLESR